MNLSDLKNGGFLDPESGESEAAAILVGDRKAETEMPWVARIALGFGAWLSGFFFTGFLAILFDLDDQLPMAIIGFFIVVGSLFLIRRKKRIFFEQLGLALGLAGHLMFFFGLTDINSNELMGPFIGALILCGPVYWFSNSSVQRFLSVQWVWLTAWLVSTMAWGDSPVVMPYLVFFGALAVALSVLSGWRAVAGKLWRPAMWASVVGLCGSLLWQSFGSDWGLEENEIGRAFGLGAAMAFVGIVWHLVRPQGKAAAGFGVFAFVLLALGIAGAPGVVVGLGLMAIARVRRDRHLGWFAIVALGHFLILFYYHLEIPLVQKSIILMVTGAIFLGVRFWLSRVGGIPELLGREADSTNAARSRILQAIVIIANCALVLAVVNVAIAKKQGIIDTGRTVFLELAPVDPRSLMQGDYMELAYAFPRANGFREGMKEGATRGAIVLKLDENDIGSFSRIGGDEIELGEAESLLKYRKWRRGFRFGIESFFFQEGFAEIYDAAKFAELRISPEGEAVLVDLRGPNREPLTSGVQPDELPGEQPLVEDP